ncbi:MAG: ABC transporter ATP-binding protein [Anaerolineae bacterium]|nr:ABC transporter ATP-binding protein [Anaerolineae bacterium]
MERSSESMPLSLKHLTFRYRIREQPAIHELTFDLQPGELLLVAGASGCGKTTLMRCINGLIPRSYRGELEGDIFLFGRDARGLPMSELSQTVGTLLQDPERQIVGSFVLNEVAFGLENLGLPRDEILKRVDETLDYLGILHLRDRETFGLSGGEKQKVALAGVLAMQPRILLLDEPLASLDPASAQEALALFRKLADEGVSIMLVEHRVEDALHIGPDTVLFMDDGEQIYYGPPDGLMGIVDYHKVKLPAPVVLERARHDPPPTFSPHLKAVAGEERQPLVVFEDVHFRYDRVLPDVLHGINFTIHKGDVVAVLGPNGAGKTTLVKHALGLLKPTQGQVFLEAKSTRDITVAQAAQTIGYVFQSPTQMLFAPTVEEELSFGPRNLRYDEDCIRQNVDRALDVVNMAGYRDSPPLALSFGQQKRISIAAVLAMRSRILMMDEPTAGQDYWNYVAFMDAILQMPGFDAVIFITHDVDLAVTYANRVVLIHDGRIAAQGPPEDVMQDYELLRSCRVVPTSLLDLNLKYLPQTGRFTRAEILAHQVVP